MYRVKGRGHWQIDKIPETYREHKEFTTEAVFYGDKKWDNYAELVSFLWTNKLVCGIIVADTVTIIDDKDNELETFVYNEEKKGYRSLKPAEWE